MTKAELRAQYPELYLEILNDGGFASGAFAHYNSLQHFDNEYDTMVGVQNDMQEAAEYEEQERREMEHARLEAQSMLEGEMESPMHDIREGEHEDGSPFYYEVCPICQTPNQDGLLVCNKCNANLTID